MKVNLFNDYRGVLTREFFYTAGEHDLPGDIAAALVEAGRAEYVEAQEPEPEPAPKPKTTRRKKAA